MIAIASWLALAATPACVQVDGGAVELSWEIRDAGGERRECADVNIDKVRTCWVPLTGDGRVEADCTTLRTDAGFVKLYRDFDCVDHRGVTRFELPAGDNAIFIRPVCTDGTLPTAAFQVPAPIVRHISSGEVVTLNQLLIVVDDDCSDGVCTCAPVAP